ncbi:tetratricopeptide repeat protein, partial [Endozoicomonas sp. ONNA2]|uniref:tetratricopeptide repeat protein n=1 Tax=Endozoicomonas sp. ONNA2 TaxID=2828741 RepID=UPI0021498F15
MNSDNVYFNYYPPSWARYQEKKYCKTVSCNRSCFNRAVRYPPPSQGASKTAPGYLSQSWSTTDNQLPKVVADFQISLSCTGQSDVAATGAAAAGAAAAKEGGYWLSSRETSLSDQSEAEWVLRKARKKESGSVNANRTSQPVAGDHRWDNIQRINEGFSSLNTGKNHQALEIAEEILQPHANLSLRDCQSANLLKARALFNLKRFDDCLQSIGQLKPPLGKGLLMVKGRALQAKHRFPEALPIFQELDKNYSISEKDKKVNGLALGRLYEDMGLDQEALTIFRKLRT